MNESFSRNGETAESTKRIQQLEFVVDTWWLEPFGECKDSIVYLIAAISMDNENQETENI